jgi:hypothetical protein
MLLRRRGQGPRERMIPGVAMDTGSVPEPLLPYDEVLSLRSNAMA